MKKLNISGKEFARLGYPESIIEQAMEYAAQFNSVQRQEVLDKLKEVVTDPLNFTDDEQLKHIANSLATYDNEAIKLNETKGYNVYGNEHIEQGARDQMETAMKLPVVVAGALMPDAHQGYGLPIGGVLAARNAVIPYGVGVDIGCRMCLSIFDIPESHFQENIMQYKRDLIALTKFGAGMSFHGQYKADHEILESNVFKLNPFIANLKDRAYAQLGTSGGGNHFVEWGIIELHTDDKALNIPKGKYLALLSHSGSRGLGATIAGQYTRIAKDVCKLPREAANLAYLSLDSEAGNEYWQLMNLAGDYASACHHIIHDKITKAVGGHLLARVENHHNFAWKEMYNGEEVIVHRKGATPAAAGTMGIIPGSMATPGYLIRGKGGEGSLNSASHGAGRQMSRTLANKTFNRQSLKDILKESDVMLIGGGPDEAPGAYKDIRQVMASQTELVDIVATFQPKMVRMADDGSRED